MGPCLRRDDEEFAGPMIDNIAHALACVIAVDIPRI
jgi:hypothetical protein